MPKGKRPARLILLRHAEKTGRPDDPELSVEGVQRAARLAEAIPDTFGPIEFIIAAKSRPTSRRPYLTVEPLAASLGLPVLEDWDDFDGEALARAVLGGKAYAERQGVLCWRHNALQALAMALGAKDAPPWRRPVYDRFWVIEYGPDGATFRDTAQCV